MLDAFKVFFTAVWTWLKPVVLSLLTVASKEILDAASKIVSELSTTELSSAEKREAAYAKIKEIMLAEGKELSDSVINLLIELAVQKLKVE